MRGYSLRSSYPLARSSQARRRLILLHGLGQNADEEGAEDFDSLPAESPAGSIHAYPQAWDMPDEEEGEYLSEPSSEETLNEGLPFVDEMFQASERRNAALDSGQSESVLDEEEADEADDSIWEDSILSSSVGEDSIILTGDEESRVFSMEDLEQPAEELPGSPDAEDRTPHYPSWYVPNFKTVKRLLESDKPVTWMFAGESAASAVDQAQGRRNFTDHFSDRIRTELGRMLDVVINTGDTGETCGNLLKNLEWRVLRFHPEVVSLLLGRNDAQAGPGGREAFQKSLEQVVQRIREAGSILVLHTPNAIDPQRAAHLADLPRYVEILREAARENNLPLVDHWEHWHRQKPDPAELRTWLSADGIRPGVYGQREMAKLIFQRFEIFDPHSPICNARVP